jgi:protein involved in polysaccharide export with SLBB domain
MTTEIGDFLTQEELHDIVVSLSMHANYLETNDPQLSAATMRSRFTVSPTGQVEIPHILRIHANHYASLPHAQLEHASRLRALANLFLESVHP